MITVNHKIKKSVWTRVFKPKGDSRVMYKYSDGRETIRVSDGHWLLKLPTCAIPTEYLGFLSGGGGIYNAGERLNDDPPDFDAITPTEEGHAPLKKADLYYMRYSTEVEIYYDNSGSVYPVNREYAEMVSGLFPSVLLHGIENHSAIKIYSDGEDVGLIMPVTGASDIERLLKDIVLAKETD